MNLENREDDGVAFMWKLLPRYCFAITFTHSGDAESVGRYSVYVTMSDLSDTLLAQDLITRSAEEYEKGLALSDYAVIESG